MDKRRIIYVCLIIAFLVLTVPSGSLQPSEQAKEMTNSIGMKLVLIPPGEFMMGSPEDEERRDECEGPQHRVVITKPFYIGKYEVTQQQYETVMGENPSDFKGRNNPVDSVRYE